MNRTDVQTLIQQFFQDPTYYTVADMNNAIQDGLDELCALTGCVMTSTTLPFQAGLTYYDFYTLIPNYLGVYAIFNHTIKRWIIPTSLRKLQQTRVDWDIAFGTPDYFAPINFRFTALFRKPSASDYGNMEVFYLASAPVLDDNTEIPIPRDHIQALEMYAETDLLEQNQEFEQAKLLLKDYQSNAEELRVLVNSKRNLGRIPQLR